MPFESVVIDQIGSPAAEDLIRHLHMEEASPLFDRAISYIRQRIEVAILEDDFPRILRALDSGNIVKCSLPGSLCFGMPE